MSSANIPMHVLMPGDPQRQTPIAVIGIGCRFPSAHGPDRLWRLLLDAVDAVDDYREDGLHQLQSSLAGWRQGPRGGFLRKIDEFDAEFFGMSPREALRIDPQTRLLLETTWEALEDAGINPERLAGSRTGVFVGQAASNYWELARQAGQPDIHTVVGSELRATLPGRVSFTFDLRGPSVSVDTACSASLTAAHQACLSIRAGESELAIVAGVNLALLGEEWAAYLGAEMLAPDGRCKFGDASANGFVRSDGVGVVVLKPLTAAIADDDRIYATILGSAINNDGRAGGAPMTPGLTSQEELLHHAYRMAGVAPGDAAYIEAHGTGTSVGDPIELKALGRVLSIGRAPGSRCFVGSVKTNIGHTEAAAGVAGLIKTALCLYHRTIPPNLHFHKPNPAVPWDSIPLAIPTERRDLRDYGRPIVAGVSSFGISGANVHMVLTDHVQQASSMTSRQPSLPDPKILVLSAQSKAALRDLALSYADFLGAAGPGGELELRDICRTAALRRKHLPSRLAVTGSTHEEVERRLRNFLDDRVTDDTFAADVLAGPPRVVFVFPGQGSQWRGMGKDLLRVSPEFRESMRRCDEAIQAEIGVSVLQQLEGDGSRLAEVDILQPALWAIEVSLSEVWRSLGLEPDMVVGHSMGEVAAAYVGGALDIGDAAAVICRRSRLARQLTGKGAMAAVGLAEDEAAKAIAHHLDTLAVAACNSAHYTILSGEPESLREVLAELGHRDVFHKMLDVDFASHSPQVDVIADKLLQSLSGIRPRAASLPIYSTVVDRIMEGDSFDAEYWVQNLRRPVRFASAVAGIGRMQPTLLIEVSPHPVLVKAIEDTLRYSHLDGAAVGSLYHHQPAWPCLLRSLAKIHALGGQVNWTRVYGGGHPVRLPRYTWQHKRYWISGHAVGAEHRGTQTADRSAYERRELAPSSPSAQGSFEVLGDIRLLDQANRTVFELAGARLQFSATTALATVPVSLADGGRPSRQMNISEADRSVPVDLGAGAPNLESPIINEVAQVLGLPVRDVRMDMSLREMGLDSLMAKELIARLRTGLGSAVPPDLMLADSSLTQLLKTIHSGSVVTEAVRAISGAALA